MTILKNKLVFLILFSSEVNDNASASRESTRFIYVIVKPRTPVGTRDAQKSLVDSLFHCFGSS